MQHLSQSSVANRLLSVLPAEEFESLAPHLVREQLDPGQTLHSAGETIDDLYFVERGFVSVLTTLSDGQPLEVGLIGAEGVVGVSVILGATHAYNETVCQTPGQACRLSASALKDALTRCPRLRELLLGYTHVFTAQVAQTAACNAHHELAPRLARWLLAAHDRVGAPDLALTQDLLAIVLGVRRSTVSLAASALQRAGVIRYQHGHITILDRVGLESAACECYEAVVDEYRALFGDYPLRVAAT